jgi:leucyl-tRNA synthetase
MTESSGTMEKDLSSYDFNGFEPKWQNYWESNKTFRTEDRSDKPKYYVLDMFPYPSGEGLHVGHPEGYTASDIVSRYKRMKGFNVLHPMGYDAFGLPAEQYALKTGTHPKITTQKNIDNIRRQIKSLGFSYDWDREIDTTDPKYYKWTQWIFLKLYNSYFDKAENRARPIKDLLKRLESGELVVAFDNQLLEVSASGAMTTIGGIETAARQWHELSPTEQSAIIDEYRLAYQAEVAVNWCPELKTVLANEEVVGGVSERGSHPVVRKPMRQWMLRITEYAERLLADLDGLDWSHGIKKLQQDWIGKSVGAEVDFALAEHDLLIRVFTTRPDTLFGATYMVLAPEHPFVDEITTGEHKQAVADYRDQASKKSDLDRTDLAKDKTGVFTGAHAINPVNDKKIPIWISDYVLISYGTGAIMSVPAHDERDHEFARQFDLPITEVVVANADGTPSVDFRDEAYSPPGYNVRSENDEVSLNGLPTDQAKQRITEWLEHKGLGKEAINYKLRDWLFSRQRYWGEPFPILQREDGRTLAVPEEDLPVLLPEVEKYEPSGTGESPLATIPEWLNTTHEGQDVKRETNTMPQWAGSCWYYLRFIDPANDQAPFDKEKENYWMPVDLYIGGAEHAVLHLLYSRFWHKVLYDAGWVSTEEPYTKLVNQGMILGSDGQKMSKSRGNVVNPDKVINDYGADSMRLYEMFMGPLDATKPWNTQGVEGVHRFLQKVWRMCIGPDGQTHQAIQDIEGTDEDQRLLHKTIKKVTGDIEAMAFNTAISQMMIFTNYYGPLTQKSKQAIESFILLLAPFAPHIAEEIWQRLGHEQTLTYEPWPDYDESLTIDEQIELAVQVNGKIRDKIVVAADSTEDQIKETALATEKVQQDTQGKTIRKVIVIKNRLVNIVAS